MSKPQYDQTEAISSKHDKDVLFAIVLTITSIALILYSIVISFDAMRTFPEEIEFYTAPGFSILVIASAILLLSVYLFIVAKKEGGSLFWLRLGNIKRMLRMQKFRSTIIVFFYFFMYMIVLWNVRIPFYGKPIPFWINTFLFLFFMMRTFNAARLRYILVISLSVALVLDFAFTHLLRVPLP